MDKKIPKLGELVLAKVKKIINYGAFCELEEYDKKEAFLHISEVAPRWIKNIHEFLHEGQRLVLKVIRVDEEKDQIDVSLKKVTEYESKNKIKEYRQAKRAEKLFGLIIQQTKMDEKKAEKLKSQLIKKYENLYRALEEINELKEDEIKLDIDQQTLKQIKEILSKNMKKSETKLEKVIRLLTYKEDGIERIKEVLLYAKSLKVFEQKLEVLYLGAPRYMIFVKTKEPKKASKNFEEQLKKIEQKAKEKEVLFEIESEEK
jgi:translation initiation factor 2 subunit 1